MVTEHVMLPWHTICCTIETWSTDSWLERSPAFAPSCQIWDESQELGDWGGGSSHSVTSLSDCRRTHSIFHSRAVDSASALSLVTQEYLESAELKAVKGLFHFHTFGFVTLFISSGGFTDIIKYLSMTKSSPSLQVSKSPNPLCHHSFWNGTFN